MRLDLSTWQEVERYLGGSQIVIVPIGSTEQHGPTGLLGTDSLTAERIAHAVGERCAALVGPTINVGMAQHHLGFPGTVSLRPSTLLGVIVDYVQSLAVHGFRRFYFLNGHGGNIATLTAAFSEIYAQASFAGRGSGATSPECVYQNWWSGTRARALSKEHFAEREGSHATPSEISLTYFLYPEAIKSAPLDPPQAPRGRIRDAAHYRASFPDGRIGSDPSGASAAIGSAIYAAAVDDVSEDFDRFARSGQ